MDIPGRNNSQSNSIFNKGDIINFCYDSYFGNLDRIPINFS